MLKSGENLSQNDTEISREDQMKINQFSRLNMNYHNLKQEIKALKDELENLIDAGSAIEEAMGDPLKLFIGEALIDVDETTAEGYHEKLTEEKQEDLEALNDKLEEIESEMNVLKSFLYARFGKNINLDEGK